MPVLPVVPDDGDDAPSVRGVCPWCNNAQEVLGVVLTGGVVLEGVAPGAVPLAGARNVCTHCGRVAVWDFSRPGNQRRQTRAEAQAHRAEPGYHVVGALLASIRTRRARWN